MWHIVTDRVAWSVGSVCHGSEPCKSGRTDWDAVSLKTWVGPRNHVLDGVHIPHRKGQFWGGGNFRGKDMPDDTTVSCAKMAEPIKMPFGLWTQVGWRKHVLHGGTLAPSDECDWSVRVRRRCGLESNYFWSSLVSVYCLRGAWLQEAEHHSVGLLFGSERNLELTRTEWF